jgi:hypothetical protein
VLRTSLLVVGFALIAALSPRDAVALPSDRPLVLPGTPLRVMLLPLKLPGEPAASQRKLKRTLRALEVWMSRASYGRLRVEGQIAPTFRVSRSNYGNGFLKSQVFHQATSGAEARGIRFEGAIPVFIAPSRVPLPSYGNADRAFIRTDWSQARVLAHELGHVLGLLHARAPTACPRPFRPLNCADHPRNNFEYGDLLDVMGFGGDRFGAYPLAVLGLAPVVDAPSGRAQLPIRPLDSPQATLLRLRTASRDWFVDSRIRSRTREPPRVRLPNGVGISRVPARYTPGKFMFPKSQRIPATDPQAGCRGPASCMVRQIFRPGRSLIVRGAFRLRVLRGRGPVRVETTWLDRTPPTVAVAGADVIRRFGTGAELSLDLRADATGAGVARVEIDQGGVITQVDADDVPGLVAGRRGHGRVRVPLVAGAAATVRLVDAAGNASPPVAAVPAATVLAASIGSSPAAGSGPATAVPVAAGQSVTISGSTDPALAGYPGRFEAIGNTNPGRFDVPIGTDGRFSFTWTPPEAGLYILQVRVPVERLPDGINFRMQSWEGHFRG